MIRIQHYENSDGLPGARAILAVGFRLRRRRLKIASGHVGSLLERYRDGKIGAEQAIGEAARSGAWVEIVPELQANFAFAKAYIADTDVSRAGLKGPAFYVDMSIFKTTRPPWLLLGERILWRNERLNLEAMFAPVLGLPEWKHVEGGPEDVRDGLEVAQHLAGDSDVLDALRAAGRA